jgi:hypothetical protein
MRPGRPLHPDDAASYNTKHVWRLRNRPKTGKCGSCGRLVGTARGTGTDWANISGQYRRRDEDDWRELCRPCHVKFDELSPADRESLATFVRSLRRRF